MKKIKKIVSIALSITTILGIVSSGTISVGAFENSKNSKVSFGVISDTHVGPLKITEQQRLKKAFQYYSNLNMDRLMVVGDITDRGGKEEYDIWKKIKDENLKIPLGVSMGNHEGNSPDDFSKATGSKPNDNVTVNGYHFITLSPGTGTFNEGTGKGTTQGGDSYEYIRTWLKRQLDQAVSEDATKPIFIFFHHPIKNTFYVSNEWYGHGLEDVFKDYPQAVTFSGHIHSPNNMPTSIWQDGGYTAINTATLSYMEMESGMVYGSIPPNANQIAQGLQISVDGSVVTVKNYDFLSNQFIPQTWTFDVTKKLPYTNKRAESTKAPVFSDESKITISNVSETSANITFDQAKVFENNVGDIVHSYKYDFINRKTGLVEKTFKTWSNYYLLPMPNKISQAVEGLKSATEYELRIYPINAYKKMGDKYISKVFKTLGEEEKEPTFDDMRKELPKADLLDVDFSGGKISDHSNEKHVFIGSDGGNIIKDNELGKYVGIFTGKNSEAFMTDWSKNEYLKINDGLTMESVFKVDKFNTSALNFFGNTESAGISFEIYPNAEDSNKADLSIWAHCGSYKIARANGVLKYGQWYHTVVIYDGSKLTLYLNGEKVAAVSATGLITTPNENSRYYVIGADTAVNHQVQTAFVGGISTARMYSEPLTSNQIKLLANRELPSLDKVKPQIKVNVEPSKSGSVGKKYIIPSAISADNSTIVKIEARIIDSNNKTIFTVNNNKADIGETSFIPERSGEYKLVYIARDKGGNEEKLVYNIKVEDNIQGNIVHDSSNSQSNNRNNNVSNVSNTNKTSLLAKTSDYNGIKESIAIIGVCLLLMGGITFEKVKRKKCK